MHPNVGDFCSEESSPQAWQKRKHVANRSFWINLVNTNAHCKKLKTNLYGSSNSWPNNKAILLVRIMQLHKPTLQSRQVGSVTYLFISLDRLVNEMTKCWTITNLFPPCLFPQSFSLSLPFWAQIQVLALQPENKKTSSCRYLSNSRRSIWASIWCAARHFMQWPYMEVHPSYLAVLVTFGQENSIKKFSYWLCISVHHTNK